MKLILTIITLLSYMTICSASAQTSHQDGEISDIAPEWGKVNDYLIGKDLDKIDYNEVKKFNSF